MEDKFLKNVNGFDLTPDNSILKLVYSESKIISLCEQYMKEEVGVELDFSVDVYSDYNDGALTTGFSFTADFDVFDEEDDDDKYALELLDKASIYEDELLETILKRVFNCPYWINISVYITDRECAMFELEMPLEVIKSWDCEVDENVWLSKVIPVTTFIDEYPVVADSCFIKRFVARIHLNEDDIEDGDILDRVDEYSSLNFHLYEVNIDDIDYMSYLTDEGVIEEYMEESIETIPPIILGLPIDCNDAQLEYFPLIDGAHRCHTLKNKGLSKIVAYIPTPKT